MTDNPRDGVIRCARSLMEELDYLALRGRLSPALTSAYKLEALREALRADDAKSIPKGEQ